ncbi:TPA: transposase, partial [Escherichia coli]|nr:transposase [Escherichia coli]
SRRFHVFAAPKQDAEHTYESLVRAFRYFGGCVKTVLVDNQKAAVLKNNNGKVVFNSGFLLLDDELRIYSNEKLVASHRLCSASSGWQTVPEHHTPLWQQVSQVEHRPLSACEELL